MKKGQSGAKLKNEDMIQIGSIITKIDGLSDQMEKDVENAVLKHSNALLEQNQKQSELSSEKLEKFQTTVSEKVNDMNDRLNKSVAEMNEKVTKNVTELSNKIDQNLINIQKQVNESLEKGFKDNSTTMGDLRERLSKIDEAQHNLENLQKDVISLNNVLTGNQTRGQYGELQLEMLLEATFPNGRGKYYNLQDDLGRVKDGEKVRPDATLIFTANEKTMKLCIDSKFPFADYNRLFADGLSEEEKKSLKASFKGEVKKKIDEIASKYLIEGITMPQAVMFVPNDGVFAYIENEFHDLVTYARNEKVIISAPSTLQAIILIFHSAVIDAERNKNLEIINKNLQYLGTEFIRFQDRWNELRKTMATATKKSEDMDKTVGKISKKFVQISTSNVGQIANEEPIQLEIKDEE